MSDTSYHSRGKQKLKRGGIWYTPQSGIWQTVWAECIPKDCVRSLHITPDFDHACVNVRADVVGESKAYALFDGQQYPLPASIPVPGFEPWSPENPKLYDFSVICGVNTTVAGDINAGDGVQCGNVLGHVNAGDSVTCGNVDGNVHAGDSVECRDVEGGVTAGDGVRCGNIRGRVVAGDSVTCTGLAPDKD